MDLTLLNDMVVDDIANMTVEDIMAAANYTDGDDSLKAKFFDDLAASDVKADIKAAIMSKKPMPGGKKSGKGTKKRKENPMLASWRKFVRKVQHEEKITYPQAMKRASKRKSEWQKGGAVKDFDPAEDNYGSVNGSAMKGGDYANADHSNADHSNSGPTSMIAGKSRRKRGGSAASMPYPSMMAGRSRRKRGGNALMVARGGSKKRRGSRRR